MTAPEPGPLADEAAKLVEAVRDWAARTFPEPERHLATGAPECRYCPVCQAVAALRGERPEVTARVAEALTAAAGALGALGQSLARPPSPDRADAPGPRASADQAAPAAVHRIDLDPGDATEPG